MFTDDAKIPPQAPKPKKSRKRKADAPGTPAATPSDPGIKELRDRAKPFCKTISDWRLVSHYSKPMLQQFIDDQEWISTSENYEQVGTMMTNAYGFILDKLAKGDGHIENEIKNDVSLRHAIHKELVDMLKTITNRFQIALFSFVDVLNGKKKQNQGLTYNVGARPSSHVEPHGNDFQQNMDQSSGIDFKHNEPLASAPPSPRWRPEEGTVENENLPRFNQSSAPHHDPAGPQRERQDDEID
jgi:hypothetical protein